MGIRDTSLANEQRKLALVQERYDAAWAGADSLGALAHSHGRQGFDGFVTSVVDEGFC
jgi:hypothetical protein